MRNLTIKRSKSFIACLAKMRVYIEDAESGDLLIGGVKCRKIGELKNGEEKSFEVTEDAAKVFVIADKLSRDLCNEYYQLPAGEDDVVLTGRNRFNPANGNAFRFDNNEHPDIIANRKRVTKKGLVVLISAAVIGFILGFVITRVLLFGDAKPKLFAEEGVSITLTSDFKKVNLEGSTLAFDSRDVAVFMTEEKFAFMSELEDYTVTEYGELVINANGFDSELITNDGLIHFEYEAENTKLGKIYRYFSYVYKDDDAFWLIQFATETQNVDKYKDQIVSWAKSVAFD